MSSKDMVNDDLGIFHSCDILFALSEMHHLCQLINKDYNGHDLLDLSKSIKRFLVTCTHSLEGISRGCSK